MKNMVKLHLDRHETFEAKLDFLSSVCLDEYT